MHAFIFIRLLVAGPKLKWTNIFTCVSQREHNNWLCGNWLEDPPSPSENGLNKMPCTQQIDVKTTRQSPLWVHLHTDNKFMCHLVLFPFFRPPFPLFSELTLDTLFRIFISPFFPNPSFVHCCFWHASREPFTWIYNRILWPTRLFWMHNWTVHVCFCLGHPATSYQQPTVGDT